MSQKRSGDGDKLSKHKAADFVAAHKEEILNLWEDSVRQKVAAAQAQERLLLRDHLLPYLETIVRLLRNASIQSTRANISDAKDFSSQANRTHGRLRATLPGYSVAEVTEEYIVLRQIITDRVDKAGLLDATVLEVIAAVNEQATLNATAAFNSSLHSLRQKAVSMLMHDIRNPLNVVSITAEAIKRKHAEHARSMDAILASSKRIDGMVSELLDAVRLEAGEGLDLQFKPCDLRDVICVVTKGADLSYPRRVETNLPDFPAQGNFDASGLARALENLISNAVKYGDQDASVRVSLEASPHEYRIAVHNWGEPIGESEQTSIFVAFSRSSDPSKNCNVSGWGLGLTYVKAVAEGHGGHVEVDSSHKAGTTFSIVLPAGGRSPSE